MGQEHRVLLGGPAPAWLGAWLGVERRLGSNPDVAGVDATQAAQLLPQDFDQVRGLNSAGQAEDGGGLTGGPFAPLRPRIGTPARTRERRTTRGGMLCASAMARTLAPAR